MSSVEGVLSRDVAGLWPQVAPLIQPCLELIDTGFDLDDILAAICAREKQLWLINGGEAAGVTSIQILPRWKRLIVEYLGGSGMSDWYDAWYDEMQRFAQAHDCKYIEVHGREGWGRLARSKGADVTTMTVSRKRV